MKREEKALPCVCRRAPVIKSRMAGVYTVACKACDKMVIRKSKEDAVRIWNQMISEAS